MKKRKILRRCVKGLLLSLFCCGISFTSACSNPSGDSGLISANGTPTSSIGTNGTIYLDELTSDLYYKSNNVWTKVGNLTEEYPLLPDISINANGYWVINGVATTVKAQGNKYKINNNR